MQKFYHNRWYTKDLYRKRIPAEFESLREFARANKNLIADAQFIQLTKAIRDEYGLDLTDATAFMVAFIGLYDNASALFTIERYEAGMKIIRGIIPAKGTSNGKRIWSL